MSPSTALRRRLTGLALSAVLLAATAGSAAAATAVQLRNSILVADDTVTLGDLFEDAGSASDVVVARAPLPGKQMALRTRGIAALARKHGLNWRRTSNRRTVSVRRDGTPVPHEQITEELELALADRMDGADIEIQIAGRGADLTVARGETPAVAVDDLQLDRTRGRFTAILSVPADSADARRVSLSGRVFQAMSVPVLKNRVAIGEVVQESDLVYRKMRVEKIGRNMVTDASALIGKSPRRPLQLNRPLRADDLGTPVLVEKGSMVTMTFETGLISLTATGRALEKGGRGDVIRVLNTRSRRTVEATVEQPGRVVVGNSRDRIADRR